MDSLSFRIPEQHPPDPDSFDTRPQAVQRWIEELPMGDIGEAARRLYSMLQQTNRLKLDPAVRADLLQAIIPTLELLLDALASHYTGLTFPLPHKSVRVAQFATKMLGEVVIAYQAVLNAREESSWLFRMTHHSLWAVSIHHMIVYLSRILANYRIIHRPYPAGLWLALHQLYLRALQYGRSEEKVERPGGRHSHTAISQEYKRALLQSLLEPQLFRRSQMDEVKATMERWLDDAKLISSDKCQGKMLAYCIRADQDAPYTVPQEYCDKECDKEKMGILLDMKAVSETIDKALKHMGVERSIELKGTQGAISRETLQILRQCWQVPLGSRQERHSSDRPVQAAIGMSANYVLMQRHLDAQGAYGISDQEMNDQLYPLFGHPEPKPQSARGESKTEVWDAIFFGTELGHNAWAMAAEEKNYRFLPARELNYTETGHCLAFKRQDIESLQVGELIGFRATEDDAVQLCMVRWLQDNGPEVSVGLARLAAEVESVLVILHQKQADSETRTAFGCMLGIGEDHRPQLFLPYLSGGANRSLYVAVDNKELPITLHEKVAISPLFEAYHFVAAESLHEPSTGEQLPLAEVNQRLHRIARSDEQPHTRDKDDFSELWDNL